MAQFQTELPLELMEQFKKLQDNSEELIGEMTRAGAEAVLNNIKVKCPDVLKNRLKLSVTYRTPTDGGINTKVYFVGYIPFSEPSRQWFSRYAKGGLYKTDKGVPASFLAILYEYGRSNMPFPKHPSVRSAIGNRSAIEQAIFDAQQHGWEILGIE